MKSYRLCLVLLLTLSAVVLQAQSYQGRILGTVTDQTGAVVTAAKVTIANTATGVSRTLSTGSAGEFVAPNLEPGPYTVTAESPGFRKQQRIGLTLEVARDIRVDFQLTAGAVGEVVTVTGEAPIVDTMSDVLGGTFSNKAITELPLLGRDFQNLVVLQPGIQRTPGGGFLSISANGNRPEDNNFIVDGLDDNDAYYGTTVINAEGVEGTPASHLPIDAIQEFNIQSSPEADYGWKPGAIINVGIKSGTNLFHGSTYYFNRNSALDARNFFNLKPDPVAALNLHQFGASAGGPIVKDKLFIFANYEGVRDVVGNPGAVNTPVTVSTGDPNVSLVDAFAECGPSGAQPLGPCSSVSQQLAKLFPNNPGPDVALNMDLNNRNREDNGIVKLDYQLSQKHSLSGSYFVGDSSQTEEDTTVTNPLFLSQSQTRAQVVGGGWVWAPNSRFTNQVHVGYNSFWQKIYQADHTTSSSAFGLDTGVTDPNNLGLPEIRIGGFVSHTLGGNESWPLFTTPNRTLQFTDNASFALGKHNLRFGGEFRDGSTTNLRNTFGSGEIRFSDLEHFVSGNVRGSGSFVFIGDSHRVVSQKSFGLFIQDDWRLAPRFTLTAGLRYDLSLPIHEQHNLLANFDPTVGLVQVGKGPDKPYNTDKNNLAPRLGFAWDLFGKGSTVIRGGAGVIYEIPHISVYIGQNNTNAAGLAQNPSGLAGAPTGPGGGTIVSATISPDSDMMSANWQNGTAVFGDLSPAAASCSTDSACAVFGTAPKLVTPYVVNWNFNIEQSVWKNAALTLAYVGNKGNKLYSVLDINQNIFANDVNEDEQSGRPFNTQFPTLSNIYQLGNKYNSIYHGLQVTLKQQSTKGLYFVAGYTWSHAIDDSSGNRDFNVQDSFNPAAERSNGDNDIRNRFTFAMTYDLPSKPGYWQMLKGWSVNSIFTAQSGKPIFYFDGGDDITGTGSSDDRWNFFGSASKVPHDFIHGLPFFDYSGDPGSTNALCDAHADPDQLTSFGCFAGNGWAITPPDPGQFGNMRRNVIYGPAYVDLDFSLIKTFRLSDRVGLELRGEFFNILNHPNLADVDDDLSDGFSGTVGIAQFTPDVAASNPVIGSGGSRHIQIGAKFTW